MRLWISLPPANSLNPPRSQERDGDVSQWGVDSSKHLVVYDSTTPVARLTYKNTASVWFLIDRSREKVTGEF